MTDHRIGPFPVNPKPKAVPQPPKVIVCRLPRNYERTANGYRIR